jgi:hypothetical protein
MKAFLANVPPEIREALKQNWMEVMLMDSLTRSLEMPLRKASRYSKGRVDISNQ